MILSQSQRANVFGDELRGMANLWDVASRNPDSATVQAASEEYSYTLAGNTAALVQRLVAAADQSVGYAPWQRAGVLALADLPAAQLLSGEIIREIGNRLINLANATLDAVLDELKVAVVEFLDPLLGTVSIIPVAGQVIDIVWAWVESLIGLIQLARASEDAQQAESTVPPYAPSPADDLVWANKLTQFCRSAGDWSPIWLPTADPVDSAVDWRRGWGCNLIAPVGPFGGGRRVSALSENAWRLSAENPIGFAPDVGGVGTLGFGAVPGFSEDPQVRMAFVHRELQLTEGATTIVDTGEWWPLARGGALQAWSQLWGNGPATWAVDTNQIAVAWRRYAGKFLEALDSGQLCHQMTAESRKKLRRFFVTEVLGVADGDAPIEVVLETMPMVSALHGLRLRQEALAETTAVAYINARTCPPALRQLLEQRQAALLETALVCRIELDLVPDPIFRAKLELAIANRKAQCWMAGDLQAPLLGPDPLGPGSPPLPPPPATAVPRLPPRAGSGAPRASTRAPTRAPTSSADGGGGAGLGLLAGAILLGLLFSSRK